MEPGAYQLSLHFRYRSVRERLMGRSFSIHPVPEPDPISPLPTKQWPNDWHKNIGKTTSDFELLCLGIEGYYSTHVPGLSKMKAVAEVMCRIFSVTEHEMFRRARRAGQVRRRQLTWCLMRALSGSSYPEIARFTEGYDHTTILHAVRKCGTLVIAACAYHGVPCFLEPPRDLAARRVSLVETPSQHQE